ncbi:MAG: ABC transporter substrate-binding protein [Andreesenia angusta]|nr:ABC transporter substrate-binding protein [Andreesenia angusta]
MGKKFTRRMLTLGLALTLGLVGVGCSSDDGGNTDGGSTDNKDEKVKIGISQFVEHGALDAAREGFEEALKDGGYGEDKVDIEYQNAQTDSSINENIAQKFASAKKDLLFGISTQSAQALYNADKETPILITAVTDPVGAELVKSLEKPETNVTGTTDNIDIEVQFKLIKELLPEAKKIGMLFNSAEQNSEVQVKEAKEKASEYDFEIVEGGVTGTNDVAQVTDSIIDDVDAIYVPTDNVVVSSLPIVFDRTIEKKIPIIGSERGQVENGALATEGINYKELGYKTGEMAIKILKGEKPESMPVEKTEEFTLTVNKETLEKLGLELPDSLKERAEMIGSEK